MDEKEFVSCMHINIHLKETVVSSHLHTNSTTKIIYIKQIWILSHIHSIIHTANIACVIQGIENQPIITVLVGVDTQPCHG